MEHADTIRRVCAALSQGDRDGARETAHSEYPYVPVVPASRSYTPYQSILLFVRDGFVDRYDGAKLVFPATLRLLSLMMPDTLPAHPNWKMSESHMMYWQLFPTVDHVVPVARGGADEEDNWVTTSMLRNQAKGHWLLEELGWELQPPGSGAEWDGLMRWFLDQTGEEPQWLANRYLERWRRAALRALAPPVVI